ncbi:MAG: arginine--tRNA ligase domain-containing protein, partial [Candidatus Hodarchaeales archaeon]
MQYESDAIQLLQQAVNLSQKEISELLDIPPKENLGDIAFPCFKLSKMYKKSPQMISKELKDTIKIPQDSIFKELRAVGAFLNFYFDESKLAKNILERIWVEENKYGFKYKENEGKTIVIEFPAPNTNKPLHLGHLRNMALGESVSRVLESQGFRVVRVNLHNDRGIHICKSMLAYQKWGNNQEPNKKEDHFVGDYYVLFTKKEKEFPELEGEARNLLKKWEAKEPETYALWKKMTNWAEKGFAQTYKRFGVKFEIIYKESDLWEKGKEIIMEGLRKKLFYRDDKGNIVVDLEEPLVTKVLLRADGTSVYITQDIYLAKRKFDKYQSYKSIIITGNEQIYHFKVLFKVLKVIGYEFADGCYHL